MKYRLILFALILVITSFVTSIWNINVIFADLSTDYGAQIEMAQTIGSMLYIHDKASAIGTDIMMENVSDYRDKNLGGYITFREAGEDGTPIDSYLVSFYTNEDPKKIKYDIHVRLNNNHEFIEHTPPEETKPWIRDLIKARQAAIEAIPEITQPINPVILPGDIFGEKGIAIYLLAGASEPNVAVLGKHYLAFVDPDNGYSVEIKPLSNSEIVIPLRGENNEKAEALAMTHLLTDWPTEIHVFASLLYKMKIMVATKSGIWKVDGMNISFMGKTPKKDP